MKYANERLDARACIKKTCEFYNEKYLQNCQAEYNNGNFVLSCKDYIFEKTSLKNLKKINKEEK